jgi:hypothetical protein
MVWVRFFVASLLLAACSGTSTPATTPTFVPTTASTTTTTIEVTTTLDRLAEIEAIYQDLEYRRLDALYRGDREAFAGLFANEEYLETSIELFNLMEFLAPPEPGRVAVVQVLNETETCIALEAEKNLVGILAGADSPAIGIFVLERVGPAWGFSYNGEGWTCDGPHPLSP